MDFTKSSQRKSWIFSEESLEACRRKAVESHEYPGKPRKFASGFHRRFDGTDTAPNSTPISADEQETVVRFHAHQIVTLVGPNASLPQLRTGETVLSTAIMLFRRFYLSNSVVEIDPRRISVACIYFASKLEETKLDVSSFNPNGSTRQLPHCRREIENFEPRASKYPSSWFCR